jgi:hypothetical protein
MERIYMVQIIDTSNKDEISAFLATTLVQHSYTVESTQSIVELWDDTRRSVELKENMDYVSALLGTGRVMDYGFEIMSPNIINTIVIDINKNIAGREIQSSDLQKELACALITSAGISRSEKVETIREIVDLWVEIKDGIAIKDDLDLIAAILTTGRIMELKARVEGFAFINGIFESIRRELDQHASGKTITKKELAAAFITSAYIEISPKVEKIRDMVDAWLKISDQISVTDSLDYITMILSTGKIKDMDAQHIVGHENLINATDKMKSELMKVVEVNPD